MAETETNPQEQTLGQDVRNIIGGVLTIAAIVVPVLLIRKLVKTIEESKSFQSLENALM